jgi:hypothetical protein
VSIALSHNIGQVDADGGTTTANGYDSTVDTCDSKPFGLCQFEVGPGDEKVVLKSLAGEQGFPVYSPQVITQIRLLWAEGPDAFNEIRSDSPSKDVTVTVGTDSGVQVSPTRIDGFQNDHIYSFKVASVDAAGNTGYYTATNSTTDPDHYCPNGIRPDCHVAQPGEVVGILADNSCFVATAAFGSPMAPQVETFRQFRNRFLVPSKLGIKLVKFYYAYSPKYAYMIAQNETLRSFARGALWPLLIMAWLSVHFGGWATLALLIALAMSPVGFALKRKRGARA